MSSIFGFQPNAGGSGDFVTLNTDQEITGTKRLRSIENELNCADLSCNTSALFTGEVEFADEFTAPHCSIYPVNGNDLCNKAYVDSIGLVTSAGKNLFLNYSEAGLTAGYKLLSVDELIADQNVSTTIPGSVIDYGITQYNNSFSGLGGLSKTIPAGVWSVNIYANVPTTADTGHVSFSFNVLAVDSTGVLADIIVATSGETNSVNTVTPAVGSHTTSVVIPETNCNGRDRLVVFITASNTRTSSTQVTTKYQFSSTYSYVTTSYVVSSNFLLASDNVWTGENTFNQPIIGDLDGTAATVAANTSTAAGNYNVLFTSTGTGDAALLTRPNTGGNYLTFDPSTGNLNALRLVGTADQADTISSIEAALNDGTVYYPTLTTSGAGAKSFVTDTNSTPLSYVPSTGVLSCTGISATGSNTDFNISVGGAVLGNFRNNGGNFSNTFSNLVMGPSSFGGQFEIRNQSTNTGNFLIRNSCITTDIVLNQLGANNNIVFTTNNVNRGRFNDNGLHIMTTSPLIYAANTGPFNIRSGSGQPISLQTNNSTVNSLTVGVDSSITTTTNATINAGQLFSMKTTGVATIEAPNASRLDISAQGVGSSIQFNLQGVSNTLTLTSTSATFPNTAVINAGQTFSLKGTGVTTIEAPNSTRLDISSNGAASSITFNVNGVIEALILQGTNATFQPNALINGGQSFFLRTANTAYIEAPNTPELNINTLTKLVCNIGASPILTVNAGGVTSTNFYASNSYQGDSAGTAGLTIANQVGNAGDIVIVNQNTTKGIAIRTLGSQPITFQTAGSLTANTRLTIADAASTFTTPVVSATFQGPTSGASVVQFGNQSTNAGQLQFVNNNAGSAMVIKVVGAGQGMYFQTAGTNNRFTVNDGLCAFTTPVQFQKSIQLQTGTTISATVTLAIPLSSFYTISGSAVITVTLPTNATTYNGTQLIFRRIAAGSSVTFNQTGGASVFLGGNSTTTSTSVTLAGGDVVISFISDGTRWIQIFGGTLI